jgi:hypothetical protein
MNVPTHATTMTPTQHAHAHAHATAMNAMAWSIPTEADTGGTTSPGGVIRLFFKYPTMNNHDSNTFTFNP